MDDDLPLFEPVGLTPVVSDAQILRAAIVTIAQLLRRRDTHVQDLQFCLLGAVLSASQDLVRVLLDVGVPTSLATIKPAITQKSLPVLALFLQHGWDINEEEEWCTPPLLSFAVATAPDDSVDDSVIGWFLSNGADPNARCQLDITPLSTAVAHASVSIIKQLFAHCPSHSLFRGQLLHCAARRASDDAEDVVRLVLDRCRPDLNQVQYKDDPFSYEVRKVVGLGTALHEAARVGHPNVVQLLISKGTDVSIRDSRGNTALEIAEAKANHAAIAHLQRAENSLAAKM